MARSTIKGQVVVEFVVDFSESLEVMSDEVKEKVYGFDQRENLTW